MGFKFTSVLVLALVLLWGCGEGHPTSYEELVKAYESAHKLKNIENVNKLIYWGSMPQKEKKRILDGIQTSFEKKYSRGELLALPEDFEMKSGSYVYPLKPEKEFQVEYKNPNNEGGALVGMAFSVGKKDGLAYIVYRSEDAK